MENTQETRTIVLAAPNPSFAEELKKRIESEKGYKVEDIVVTDEDLIHSLEKARSNPNCKGLILTSDLAKKNRSSRLEYLSDLLVTVRERYPDLSICLLSKEEPGHPFLFEMVHMGIYNIFLLNQKMRIDDLLETLENPKTFSEVSFLREVDKGIPWRPIASGPQKIEIINHSEEVSTQQDSGSREQRSKGKSTLKLQKQKPFAAIEEIDDDLLEMAFPKEIFIQEKIVGTVVVAVTGVAQHLGTTQTSISIASYLSNKGYRVALVEGNYSQDFERIHSLYEGSKKPLSEDDMFELYGIDHFKYREPMYLGDILTAYEYVVLDLGNIDDTPFSEEFYRAHVKCVMCPGQEWKQHWINEFAEKLPDNELFIYLVPTTDISILEDIEKIVDSEVVALPLSTAPYETDSHMEKSIEKILDGYLKKGEQKALTKSTVIVACMLTAVFTCVIIGTFLFI